MVGLDHFSGQQKVGYFFWPILSIGSGLFPYVCFFLGASPAQSALQVRRPRPSRRRATSASRSWVGPSIHRTMICFQGLIPHSVQPSFFSKTCFFPWILDGFLKKKRIPGKNGEGTPKDIFFQNRVGLSFLFVGFGALA